MDQELGYALARELVGEDLEDRGHVHSGPHRALVPETVPAPEYQADPAQALEGLVRAGQEGQERSGALGRTPFARD